MSGGAGRAAFLCERCGCYSRAPRRTGLDRIRCPECGGVAWRDPYPESVVKERLAALIQRLEQELNLAPGEEPA